MTIAPGTRMTLDEFLALPEEKPYLEFVNGEVVPKAVPNDLHGTLVIELGSMLREYLRKQPIARVATEVRHVDRDESRAYLPDLAVTLRSRLPAVRPGEVEIPPDIAVEVLSPSDRPGRVLEKVAFYLRTGTTVVWLVDPEDETTTVYRRSEEPHVLTGDDVLEAEPVLPGFTLAIGALFAVLHEGEEHGQDV